MKILHVVQGYTPAIGGTERLIQKVSEQLVARHGDAVTVYTTTAAVNCELFWRRDQPQLAAGVEMINGVTVRRFPVFNRCGGLRRLLAGGGYLLRLPFNDRLRALYNGPIVPGMTQAIAGSAPDVAAGSSFPLLHMHYLVRGARQGRFPVILHGGLHPSDPFGFDRPMIYAAIRQADAYIANTSFERDFLTGKGIDPAKISVIGVGVDTAPFAAADGRGLRARYGWGEAPLLAFVGQQAAHKGLDLIMEAMPAIWEEAPETCLLIAGAQTSYSPRVRAWQARLPAARRAQVAVIDNFSEDEKPAIFAASDVALYPSAHESFGIVFLEAWAAQRPVIGLRTGAIASVIDDGRDGLLLARREAGALATAVLTLHKRPDLRRAMGAAGLQKVRQRYTWEIVADKFRDVYNQTRAAYTP